MRRWIAVLALAIAHDARADGAVQRFEAGVGIGGVVQKLGVTPATSYAKGVAMSLAYARGIWVAPHVTLVVHLGLDLLARRHDDNGDPLGGLPSSLSVHPMLEYHFGGIAVGAGLGFDLPRNTSQFVETGSALVIGANAQVRGDLVRLDQGTLGLFVGATKLQLGAFSPGSYEHQDFVTLVAGVTFWPE